MIDNIFRRVIAYVMDMILVSIVVSSIISAKVVNFQIDEYNKKYDEYNELYNLYIEQHSNKIENCDDLEKAIEEEKIREHATISGVFTGLQRTWWRKVEFFAVQRKALQRNEIGNKNGLLCGSPFFLVFFCKKCDIYA
jgi:hypothetical protein